MMRQKPRVVALTLAASLLLTALAFAQSSSGVIFGRVLDHSGLPVPNADVTLVNTVTRDAMPATTSASGEFVFPTVQPGSYSVLVKAAGFKNLEKTGLALSSAERLSTGSLIMEVGSVTEAIEVKAEVTPVQTSSSERSALLDRRQVSLLMTKGRDLMGMLVTMPGVVNDSEGGGKLGGLGAPSAVSGTRGEYTAMSIDGMSGNPRGGNNLDTPINLDAIAEVKVLSNNYQAEYGKAMGAIINIVSKSGGPQFHGGGYYYNRNEAYNANNFFSNRQGLDRPRYRYNTLGSNLGGPVLLPGGFNRDRQKLFFFFSQEYIPVTTPNGPRNYTVPTALEKSGDFSQSRTTNAANTPITVKDPLNNFQPFPGNVVPTTRIDPNMKKMLAIFPDPNVSVASHAYNLQRQDTLEQNTHQEILRVDYNITQTLRSYFRGTSFGSHNKGPGSTVNKCPWMPTCVVDYALTGPNLGGSLVWTISPSVVNEFNVGYSRWTEDQTFDQSWLPTMQRDKLGIALPQQYPDQNPYKFVPALTNFGSISNAALIQWEGRFPMVDIADSWSFADNLSKVWSNHLFKFGVQVEHAHYLFDHSGTSDIFAGAFNFAPNSSNTFNDTGYGYANAILGYFNQYQESTKRSQYSPVSPVLEWYAQDSWRVTPRLTLDLGVRFTAGLQQYAANNMASSFVAAKYARSQAPLLYQPALINGKRGAVDPRNPGVLLDQVFIGYMVPGTGDLKNGLVVAGDPGYPRALVDYQGILPAPKLGFAWDPAGNGRTAVRGGVALNYQPRNGTGFTGDTSTNPPLVYRMTQNYGNTGTYMASTGYLTPPDVGSTLIRNNRPPRSYQASLSVQRNIGFDTVVDVGYVGSFGRFLGMTTQLNQIPYGTRLLDSSNDPTKPGQKLTDVYLRPFMGYNGISLNSFGSSSSYHSLQTQVNKRLSHGLQVAASYTWSKAMGYTDADKSAVVSEVSRKEFNYGPSTYDRTHVVSISYLYDLPKVSRLWNHVVARKALDGWQLVGVTRFNSGAPLNIGVLGTGGFSNGLDITGGGDGWRPVMSKSPVLPTGERTVERWFDQSVFSPPALVAPKDLAGVMQILALGNTPKGFARGPGINNWNISLYKTVKITEKVNFSLRAETYNTFNHTQFSTVNTSPQWNPATGVYSSSQFGQVTAARDPRIIQVAARVNF
jgi:hypothetical protein